MHMRVDGLGVLYAVVDNLDPGAPMHVSQTVLRGRRHIVEFMAPAIQRMWPVVFTTIIKRPA